MQHESDTSDTSATRVRQDCCTNDTSVTRAKNFDFVMTRVNTYFHTLIFTIWQVKDYKERSNFILRTTCWKCLFSIRVKYVFTRVITKSKFFACVPLVSFVSHSCRSRITLVSHSCR